MSDAMTPAELVAIIDRAFDSRSGSSVRQCECGRTFFNPSMDWDWEDGEIEKLVNDPNATALTYAVTAVVLDGRYFVSDCRCWHERAIKVGEWLCANQDSVAEFFAEKRRVLAAKLIRTPEIIP